MLQSLQLLELGDYSSVVKVANFATLVSTYLEGTYESQLRSIIVLVVITDMTIYMYMYVHNSHNNYIMR